MTNRNIITHQSGLGVIWPKDDSGYAAPISVPGLSPQYLARWRLAADGTVTGLMAPGGAASPVLSYRTDGSVAGLTMPDLTVSHVPRVIAQTGLPIIVPSSGSVGVNGALTGITALPQIYGACYLWLPTGGAYTGSVTGLYYTVMSSTTAGTVYNNRYTSGVPSIPASPTAIVSAEDDLTGPGAFTQTTSLRTVLSLTVPGGLLGVNGRIDISGRMSHVSSSNVKTMKVSFGALDLINTNATNTTLGIEFANVVQNRGAANRQVAKAAGFGSLGTTTSAAAVGTVDTAADVTLTVQLNIADATEYVMLERIVVEAMPV